MNTYEMKNSSTLLDAATASTCGRPDEGSDEKLRSVLGIINVHYVAQKHNLAVVDSPLANS